MARVVWVVPARARRDALGRRAILLAGLPRWHQVTLLRPVGAVGADRPGPAVVAVPTPPPGPLDRLRRPVPRGQRSALDAALAGRLGEVDVVVLDGLALAALLPLRSEQGWALHLAGTASRRVTTAEREAARRADAVLVWSERDAERVASLGGRPLVLAPTRHPHVAAERAAAYLEGLSPASGRAGG